MHRSGSSLTTQVFQRLGMSLGPFELIGPAESNRHGHFEPVPVNHFDMELQQRVFGFNGDMPQAEDVFQRFLASDGKWDSSAPVAEGDLEAGRQLIRQLIESGRVSGFKDPRVVLLWPYWRQVLGGFSGLRVVLLTLIRSPHEVAMSIFMRGRGKYTYHDALSVTAVNLRRIQEIRQTWPGEQVLVRFDPRVYASDMRAAAAACGLAWQEDVFRETYDPSDKHHDPTRVQHPAQQLFDALSNLPAVSSECELLRLAGDAAVREKLLQMQITDCLAAVAQLQDALSHLVSSAYPPANDTLAQLKDSLAVLSAEVAQLRAERDEQRQSLEAFEQRLQAFENRPFQWAMRQIRDVCGQFGNRRNEEKAA
jgi:hypothetical protein